MGYTSLVVATIVAWLASRETSVLAFAALTLLLVSLHVVTYGRVRDVHMDLRAAYQQIESMFSMFSVLELNRPLPPMRGYAVRPDFGNLLIRAIYEHRPRLVVEAGSGTSTILIAYCLKQLGTGRLVALEHVSDFAIASRRELASHGLQDVAVVRHAPLRQLEIRGRACRWYDPEQVRDLAVVDMVVVDGPPAHVSPLARYPAVPLLFPVLRDGAVIVLDDGKRRDERETVRLWKQEYGCLEVEHPDTEKGATVLRLEKDGKPE